MQWSSLILALLAGEVSAQGGLKMMRFACSQLTIDRVDPIGAAGDTPSPHLHQVAGGNSFNASMKPVDYDPSTASTCTSCTFSEDFSNYWTAVMYFKAKNGTYKRVPQYANAGLQQTGGLTVYYIPSYSGNVKVTAFKPGFRMVTGDPQNRQASAVPRGVCHRCVNKNMTPFGGAPCTGDDTANFPKKFCAGGIRMQVTFPTCWDGKNLDSPDHKSHVSYTTVGTFESGGSCPSTHPVKIPQVMYEVMWDTTAFEKDWPTDGSNPLVYSMGDASGLGNHGDYLFGWKGDALQKAMDSGCQGNSGTGCPKTQSVADSEKCVKSQEVKESVDGWLTSLPGNMPVT